MLKPLEEQYQKFIAPSQGQMPAELLALVRTAFFAGANAVMVAMLEGRSMETWEALRDEMLADYIDLQKEKPDAQA